MRPLYMKFPTKLDENIELLAKNNRFSEIEKGTLLLHSMAVHDELTDDERKYGEAVAAGWMNKGVAAQNNYPTTDPEGTYHALMMEVYGLKHEDVKEDIVQLQQYYGKIRAAVMNGIPTGIAQNAIGVDEGNSRFVPKSRIEKSMDDPRGFRCRDCTYISKSSDDAFEHTKTKLHTKGFDALVK